MTIMTDYAGFYGIYDNPGERFFLMLLFLSFIFYLFIYLPQTLLSSQYFIAVETTSLPILLENTQKSAKTKFHLHTSHLFFLLNAWLDIDVVVLGPQRTKQPKKRTRVDVIIEIFPPTGGPTKRKRNAWHPTRLVFLDQLPFSLYLLLSRTLILSCILTVRNKGAIFTYHLPSSSLDMLN